MQPRVEAASNVGICMLPMLEVALVVLHLSPAARLQFVDAASRWGARVQATPAAAKLEAFVQILASIQEQWPIIVIC